MDHQITRSPDQIADRLEASIASRLRSSSPGAGVPFKEEVSLPIDYKGPRLRVSYRVDFICWGEVVIELKALQTIGPLEMAQALNYLRAAGLHRALVLNFGARSFQFKRVVWDYRG